MSSALSAWLTDNTPLSDKESKEIQSVYVCVRVCVCVCGRSRSGEGRDAGVTDFRHLTNVTASEEAGDTFGTSPR